MINIDEKITLRFKNLHSQSDVNVVRDAIDVLCELKKGYNPSLYIDNLDEKRLIISDLQVTYLSNEIEIQLILSKPEHPKK